jgi:hypothetical protein
MCDLPAMLLVGDVELLTGTKNQIVRSDYYHHSSCLVIAFLYSLNRKPRKCQSFLYRPNTTNTNPKHNESESNYRDYRPIPYNLYMRYTHRMPRPRDVSFRYINKRYN